MATSQTAVMDLPEKTVVTSSDYLILDNGTNTNKIKADVLLDAKQSKSIAKSNISVSVTPTALSSYQSWDSANKYGYSASVTVSGLTTNSLIQNIVMTDTLLDSIAPVITTSANSLTFYCESATALIGTIYTLVTTEVE